MPTDAELTFADHAGRFYARRYGFPPMVGRLIGYLAICEPREQSIGELAEALLASRSAITGAIKVLEATHLVRRSRAAGERMDRVSFDLNSPQAFGFDVTEYLEQAELAREGLQVIKDAPIERKSILLQFAAFSEFLAEKLPVLEQEWKKHRAALIKAGKLHDDSPH